MESAGFKEWALVVEALGRGEQTLILRKGGIAEGRAGFGFRETEFFLFPTFFHEQVDKVRGDQVDVPSQRAGEIEIKFFARLQFAAFLDSSEKVTALEPFHILRSDVVRERFDYDTAAGIHVGFVRVFRLEPSWIFPDARSYGGCRSWVALPDFPQDIQFVPVLSDAEHTQVDRDLRARLGLAMSEKMEN